MGMPPPGIRERIAVIRALLAAVDAELDQIADNPAAAGNADFSRINDQIGRGICPECGVSWMEPSPACPKYQFNRHPKG